MAARLEELLTFPLPCLYPVHSELQPEPSCMQYTKLQERPATSTIAQFSLIVQKIVRSLTEPDLCLQAPCHHDIYGGLQRT